MLFADFPLRFNYSGLPYAVKTAVLWMLMEEIMEALRIILMVVQVLCALVLTLVVTLQSGKSSGLGSAISGSSETFLSKNKASTFDAKLTRATKWIAGVFMLLTLALNII